MADGGRTTTRRGWRRALAFRAAAVLLALTPFVLAEAVFAVLGWGDPDYSEDPFVGFRAVRPLFVRSADGLRYEIPPSRQRFFCPDSFAASKPPGEYRIFCLGGSTVQGRPFAIETSFTTWLEIDLRAADPTRSWQVVNCGGISYASYRLVPILEEVLGYEPDLIVVYTGHNEFLEDREYGHIRDLPAVAAGPMQLVTQMRTWNLLREGYLRVRGVPRPCRRKGRPVLAAEADAILDYRDGMAKYHRDDAWRRGVMEHYRHNLLRLVGLARQAGTEIVLMNPVSNLRDCPPMKSQHRAGLTAGQLRRWEALHRRAIDLAGTDPAAAAGALREAMAIDDQYADLHFLLAKVLDAAGRMNEARQEYILAKELDVCPLRMLEPMHRALREVAEQTDTPLVDVRGLIESRSRHGIVGGYLMLDHVHPSIAGHRAIADALLDEMARRGIVTPSPGWRQRRDEAARKHLDSLGQFYFARGLERLESVRGWARGRATHVRATADANSN